MSSTRQLAAIMFTDIVGYTALMGEDSNKALEIVRISKEIQKPLVEKHNGKWLKEMGDGAMAQFSTALDAVNCSIEIQEVARAKLDGKLRIGIHSGDITIENDDVYGDGVNVASRLESIADPGGIYISDSIQKAIQGQTDVQAKYLGEVKLKNVAYSVRTYALQGVGLPVPEVKDEKALSGHIWAEIKRRGILRSGFAYLVIAVLLILLQREAEGWLTLPQWIIPVLLTILIFGFPMAMYFAWNFERSPEGFVRTSSKESWQNPYNAANRKPLTSNFIIGILLLIMVAMYAYPRYFDETGPANTTITDRSLAVLPFDNLSNDPSQDYIGTGMMEAILNHLNKIEGLRLTSRTTMMTYKGSNKTVKEIANEVAVRYVLEGSVIKVENTVRIVAQLIDGQKDEHIWSNTFDRNFSELLSIQSEVAQQIAEMLEVEITPATKEYIEAVPTRNAEAYDLYLQAVSFEWVSIERRNLLDEAILLDPQFASALAELGAHWAIRALSNRSYIRKAETYLNKVLYLDPDLAKAYRYLSMLNLWLKWDFLAAERQQFLALSIDPFNFENENPDLHLALGRFGEALKVAEQQVIAEPNNGVFLGVKAMILFFNNRPEEALKILEIVSNARRAPQLNVRNYYGESGRAYLYLQKFNKVVEHLEEGVKVVPGDPRLMGTLAIAHHYLGNLARTNELILQLNQLVGTEANSPSFYLAMIYAQKGEIDTAFEWLDKAYEDHEAEMYWLKVEPPFEPLHDHPRWQEMLDKVGFTD